jgi:hypothetical protein
MLEDARLAKLHALVFPRSGKMQSRQPVPRFLQAVKVDRPRDIRAPVCINAVQRHIRGAISLLLQYYSVPDLPAHSLSNGQARAAVCEPAKGQVLPE